MEHPSNPGRRAVLGVPVAAAALLSVPAMAQGRRSATERPPLAASAEERRILAVLDEVYRKHRYLSVPEPDGRLLRVLVESIGARHVVELGTSTGYSGLWILLGLARTGGRLITYEIDRGRHAIARGHFEKAGLLAQVTMVLGDAHEEVTKLKEPLDLLFIDADKEGYPDYLKKLGPLVRAGGLIAAHNMASPPPDPRYVEAVTTQPAYETVFLNMHDSGMGVTLKKR
jgi:predicted O-methyltransferase YrrM